MPQLLKLPREVEKVLGAEASDKFFEFLNQALDEQKDRVMEKSDDKFSKSLLETRSELVKMILETRSELERQISSLRVEMNEKFTDIHKQIAIQTKWILVAFLGAAVLYPVITKIVNKLFS